ncbi:MAG: glycosyltransferase family 4 protein [Chloroflexi bacterium]|nr:glycosyltransferase family 4 protein [Chloroflexota bacterium]
MTRSNDVLLVVSADVPAVLGGNGAQHGPRKDYLELQRELGATMLDRSWVSRSRFSRMLARMCGASVAQAWLAFQYRRRYRAIFTDGEHIGIPLALFLKLARARTPHVTIGHRITAGKKRLFFRGLGVQSHIGRIVLHSRRQCELAVTDLGIQQERLTFVPYQVDVDFWRPRDVREERLISSAGLEFRDYPTLISAVDGLDVHVVIGAASYWSRRRNNASEALLPSGVEVGAFNYDQLRDLYARSAIVVVPLVDVDFQAGVTSILEAMAMGKPVIVTRTQGQTDVVEDIADATGPQRVSLLRPLAEEAGVALEPTGIYVPPADPVALRNAIIYLLDHPDERRRLGSAGRRTVEQLMRVDQFASRLGRVVEQVTRTAA